MRHLLITLPVAILLSVVACNGSNDTAERRGEQASDQVDVHRDAMADALKKEDRDGFVREANQALDTAERQLRDLSATTTTTPSGERTTTTTAPNASDATVIREDIRIARDDLSRITSMPTDQWKDTGKEVDKKVKEISNKLDQLTG